MAKGMKASIATNMATVVPLSMRLWVSSSGETICMNPSYSKPCAVM